jgi:hypothetical protein
MEDALNGKNMETISMDDLIAQAKSRVVQWFNSNNIRNLKMICQK